MDLRGLVQSLATDLLGDQKMSDEDFEKIYNIIEEKVDNQGKRIRENASNLSNYKCSVSWK